MSQTQSECPVRAHVPIPGTVRPVHDPNRPYAEWYFAYCRCGVLIMWDRRRHEWVAVEEQSDD